jgi:exosortase/archaeosortase family protein
MERIADLSSSPQQSSLARIWRQYGAQLRFVLLGGLLFVALNALLYYPYRPEGIGAQLVARYLAMQAAVAGAVVALFDDAVVVKGAIILGRFPMHIVMECTALDAQALFAAFVISFQATGVQKLLGLVSGISLLWLLNALRIVVLYFIGLHWPATFRAMHEEVLALAFVAAALLAFALWTRWVALAQGRSSGATNGTAPSIA